MFVGLANNFQLEKVPPALLSADGLPQIVHIHDNTPQFEFSLKPNQVFVISSINWWCISKIVKFVNYGPPSPPTLNIASRKIVLDPTLPVPGKPSGKAFDPPIAMSYEDRICTLESPHFFKFVLNYSGYLFSSTGKPINKLKCIAFTMFDQNTQGISIHHDGKLDELRTTLLETLNFDMDAFPWEALGAMPEVFQHGITNLMLTHQQEQKRLALPGGSVSDFIADCTQLENLPWDTKVMKELAQHMTLLGWRKL